MMLEYICKVKESQYQTKCEKKGGVKNVKRRIILMESVKICYIKN